MSKKIISVCLILLYSISTIGVAVYDCHCDHSNTLVLLSSDDCSCNHSDLCEHCTTHHNSREHNDNLCDSLCSDHDTADHDTADTTDNISSDKHSCKVIYESLSSYADAETQISSNAKGLSLAVLFPTIIEDSPLVCYTQKINFKPEKASKTPLIYRNCQLRL